MDDVFGTYNVAEDRDVEPADQLGSDSRSIATGFPAVIVKSNTTRGLPSGAPTAVMPNVRRDMSANWT
jgi:hypothetical protein